MVRSKILWLHTWTGLTVGLVMAFLAITGAGFVLRPQLDRVVYKHLLVVPACSDSDYVSLDQMADAARAAHPGGVLDQFVITREQGSSWAVQFLDKDMVYVNPCNGQVLGIQNEYGGFFGTMDYLHRFRFLPDSGKLIAGWCTALYIVALLAFGVYLWWPKTRASLMSALKFNPRLPGIARTLSLHKVVGIYSSVLLLAIATMALPIAFKSVNDLLYVITGSKPFAAPPRSEAAEGVVLSSEQLWQTVLHEMPDLRWATMRLPRHPGDAVYTEVLEGPAPHEDAKSYVFIDSYSGKVLLDRHYATDTPAGRKLYLWMIMLHSAVWGGVVYQSVVFLGALGMGVQAYSGFSPYLRRKFRKSAKAQLSLQVVAKTMVATDICSFELADPKGKMLPPFSAGSHIDLILPDGKIRQYSLCNDPKDTHRYVIGVLRMAEGRGGSKQMHDEINEGDILAVGSPKNHFPLAHGAKRSLLIAGGIGITPILCMAERLSNIDADFTLHYCVRSKDRAAFLDRIERSKFAGRVQLHTDEGPIEQRFDIAATLESEIHDTHIYVCGPGGFMDAVIGAARHRGWPEDHIHREYFAGTAHASALDKPFEVKIASTGKIVPVAKEQTVVDALAKAGIDIATSCGNGVCGTCLTRVLDGEPEHRDLFQTAEELARNDQFTPCCSRSRSPMLVLDL